MEKRRKPSGNLRATVAFWVWVAGFPVVVAAQKGGSNTDDLRVSKISHLGEMASTPSSPAMRLFDASKRMDQIVTDRLAFSTRNAVPSVGAAGRSLANDAQSPNRTTKIGSHGTLTGTKQMNAAVVQGPVQILGTFLSSAPSGAPSLAK